MRWDQRMVFDTALPTFDQGQNDYATNNVAEEVEYERDPFEG